MTYGIKIEDERILLKQAVLSHRDAAEEMKQEFFDNSENVINGSALFDHMSFDEWLENTDRNHNPETVRSDWAVATTFFAIRHPSARLSVAAEYVLRKSPIWTGNRWLLF